MLRSHQKTITDWSENTIARKYNDFFTRFLIGILYLNLNFDVTVSSVSHIPNPTYKSYDQNSASTTDTFGKSFKNLKYFLMNLQTRI